MKVIKKDGVIVDYNEQKIINAVNLSSQRVLEKLYQDDYAKICNKVLEIIDEEDYYDDEHEEVIVAVLDMHSIVTKALEECGYENVAKSYREYRNYKQDFVKILDKAYVKAQMVSYLGDVSNANTDSTMISTQRSLVYGELNRELYKKFFLTKEERQMCKDGYIYIQDMRDRRDGVNCCLADVGNMLKGGFEMGNIWYNEPKTLDVAFDVISDIMMSMASQQYGGFTIPRVDNILSRYADKSYKKYYDKYILLGISEDIAEEVATNDVRRDMEQGFQSWEIAFNSVASSRGDYPFVSISFGLETSKFGAIASEVALYTRKNGQGKEGFKKPVLFPKLTFLYDENLHGEGKELSWLFDCGIECSAKSMYPDWLSLTGEGYIPSIYKKYGQAISLMG